VFTLTDITKIVILMSLLDEIELPYIARQTTQECYTLLRVFPDLTHKLIPIIIAIRGTLELISIESVNDLGDVIVRPRLGGLIDKRIDVLLLDPHVAVNVVLPRPV
jgi:hypothetical protein